jgi:hypothetical protein
VTRILRYKIELPQRVSYGEFEITEDAGLSDGIWTDWKGPHFLVYCSKCGTHLYSASRIRKEQFVKVVPKGKRPKT